MKNQYLISTTLKKRLLMKLRIIAATILVLAGIIGNITRVSAQDIIILKTGDEIKSSVIEIGTDAIKYRKYENLSGPVYNLETSKIFMIKYKNGSKDVFDTVTKTQKKVSPANETKVPRTPSSEPIKTTGIKIYQNNEKLSPSEVRRLFSPFPDALHSYNSGRVLNGFDVAVAIAGIGVFAAVLSFDGRFWPAFGAMSPFLIGDMILYRAAHKKINACISIYNSSNRGQSSYKIDFGIQQYGIGVALKF
jgi:hypothetical protein